MTRLLACLRSISFPQLYFDHGPYGVRAWVPLFCNRSRNPPGEVWQYSSHSAP